MRRLYGDGPGKPYQYGAPWLPVKRVKKGLVK